MQESPAHHKAESEARIIYSGNMTRMIKKLKFFSMSTSLMGIGLQTFIILTASRGGTSSLGVIVAGITTSGVILSPLLVNLVTKRYVTELSFDASTKIFRAKSLSFLNRCKITEFRASDVSIPTVSGFFTSFKVFGQPFFVDPEQFEDIKLYEHLMGYDLLDKKYGPPSGYMADTDMTDRHHDDKKPHPNLNGSKESSGQIKQENVKE